MQKNATVERMIIVVARYMGMTGTDQFLTQNYRYDKDWNQIVNVCRKIEQSGYIVEVTFNIAGMCTIWNQNGVKGSGEDNDPIMSVLQAIYQFITWYNQQKQTNE